MWSETLLGSETRQSATKPTLCLRPPFCPALPERSSQALLRQARSQMETNEEAAPPLGDQSEPRGAGDGQKKLKGTQ